ncbi:transmembrane protein [Cystoisospora suis]|uniref:Transmembrane protein n=1 Tax=Cystoisospora suis TaxID=483139 RepID=A0A2C6LAS2_9APIC|nr:transmembrane protein [Cystoisospora suis]
MAETAVTENPREPSTLPNRVPSYKDLVGHSLKATSMDHGMQYSSIYWETGHRTYLPFWASLTQKFSWKIMDDQIRSALGLPKPVTAEPFVFAAATPYVRRYYGDQDISVPVRLRAPMHFAFVPAGTRVPWSDVTESSAQAAASRGAAATAFRAVLESAWKCDIDKQLSREVGPPVGMATRPCQSVTSVQRCPINIE